MKYHNVVLTVEIIVSNDDLLLTPKAVAEELAKIVKGGQWFNVTAPRVIATREGGE